MIGYDYLPTIPHGPANQWNKIDMIYDASNITSGEYRTVVCYYCNYSAGLVHYGGLMIIDLTEKFGEGNEPSLEWCHSNIEYLDGKSYIISDTVKIAKISSIFNEYCEK